MAEDHDPDDDFQELLRRLFGGAGGEFDPAQFEGLTGMQIDPAVMAGVMQQLQGAFAASGGDGGISWDLARRQALHIANQDGLMVTDGQRSKLHDALSLADLWLSEATSVPQLAQAPRAITRGDWVEQTLPVWQELAEPVATSIADALMRTLEEQTPEDMQAMVHSAGKLMRTIGGSLFATQLGQVVGRLSAEVISGGEIGIPLLPAGEAAILPQNFADFGRDLEIDEDQLALYIAARELAHARLFRHAKWLRLQVISQVTEYARGIHIDTSAMEDLAGRFDPSRPEELRQALVSGALIPEPTPTQIHALNRLESLLATIEGWVDVVTTDSTTRLPRAAAIAETARRRRAAGGPAEEALSALVGLTLRPRRLREAAVMWRAVTDAVGVEARDALWDYPDFMPTSDDIDNPQALITRIQDRLHDRTSNDESPVDAIDDAIARILAGEEPSAEPGVEQGSDPDAGPGQGGDADSDEESGGST